VLSCKSKGEQNEQKQSDAGYPQTLFRTGQPPLYPRTF
jgi:hypothetical protein